MVFQHKKTKIAAGALGFITLALSLGSGALIGKLSLPLPIAVPIMNACIAIAFLGLIVLLENIRLWAQKRPTRPPLLILSLHCVAVLPLALGALSANHALPSDLQICSSEIQWARMFRRKDEEAIRFIQDQLRCCGLNSMHDRAWPFPSRNTDARTCERTQGYIMKCGDLWRYRASIAAGLSLVGSALNLAALMLLRESILDRPKSHGSRFVVRDTGVRESLLGAGINDEGEEHVTTGSHRLPHVDETLREEERRAAQRELS